MKKSLFIAAALPLLASCASDELVDTRVPGNGLDNAPISFVTSQENITRAQLLQKVGHYNFGVFAYKSTEKTNNIMENYLVGYMDEANKKGYYMTTGNQTTLGDTPGAQNGSSQWAYEKMGSAEYDYTGAEGYYTKDDATYMSNVPNQYLRYWDKSAPYTMFYAYTPYINGTGTATYINGTRLLYIPDKSIVAAMVEGDANPEACEYMYASTKVEAADYGKDVALHFKRLIAKVNIKFWEDLDGYSVRILDLKQGTYDGVQAVPAVRTGDGTTTPYSYTKGNYYKKAGANITFPDPEASTASDPTIALITSADGDKTDDPLVFSAPTAAEIGTTRVLASPSASSYYAIPNDNGSGLTFHVTYELTSNTGEKVIVKDATAYVPAEFADWSANTHYTYIFKITKGSNGSTEANPTIDPSDPDVPVETGLYPIVFDNCTVEDWTEKEYEPEVTPGTKPVNYSVHLSTTSMNLVSATDVVYSLYREDAVADPAISGKWTVKNPAGTAIVNQVAGTSAGATLAASEITTAGTYTVIFEPEHVGYNNTTSGDYAPATSYTATFEVIGHYTLGFNDASTTAMTVGTGTDVNFNVVLVPQADGATYAPSVNDYEVVYPAAATTGGNVISGDNKNRVYVKNATTLVVEKNAVAGDYKINYTTPEGKTADITLTVASYAMTLDKYTVNLTTASQTVTPSWGVTPTGTITYAITQPESATGVTFVSTTGVSTVAADAATNGEYVVTATIVNNGSTMTYTKSYTVKDVHTLSLSTALVDNDIANTITATAITNGTTKTTGITVVGPDGATGVTISGATISTATNATPGTYTVKFQDKEATFIIQD